MRTLVFQYTGKMEHARLYLGQHGPAALHGYSRELSHFTRCLDGGRLDLELFPPPNLPGAGVSALWMYHVPFSTRGTNQRIYSRS